MKEAIAKFITDHPIMTFLLADTAIGAAGKTIRVLLRGYPPEVDRSKLEEVEVVEEESSDSGN